MSCLKIKNAWDFKHLPSKYFVSYIQEAEFKLKNGNKNYEQIIKEFFDSYFHNNNLREVIIEESNEYLNDTDFMKDESDSD